MKLKKRSRKTSRGKKSLDRVNVIIIILVLILVLFFLYNILIKEGDFLGELATVGPVGEEGIDLYAEATMRPGVTLPNEVEGCILELESPPFFRNPGSGRQRLVEEHALVRQQLAGVVGRDVEIEAEFYDAFNGMTLPDISMDDCNLVKNRISVVREIHPNIQFTALLDESVKSIKGHLAYSEFGLTGKDTVIAVIDTGIDPNHESLDDLDDIKSGASVGNVKEGQTTSVSFKDKSYDVSIMFIDNDEVVFDVNGERAPSTGKLNKGDTFRLSDGRIIAVKDISKLEIAGEVGSADFSIGTTSSVEDDDPKIIGWKDFVNFRPEPYDDHGHGTHCAGIAAGTGGVPLDAEDVVYDSLFEYEKDGDNSVEIFVKIKDGKVSFNPLFGADGMFLGTGKANDERLAVSANNEITFREKDEDGNDYHRLFVASYNTASDGESYLLRAKVNTDPAGGRNLTTVDKNVGGSWVEVCEDRKVGDTCDIGDVSLTVASIYYVAGRGENVTFKAAYTGVSFNKVFDRNGNYLELPTEEDLPDDEISLKVLNKNNFLLETVRFFFDSEDKTDIKVTENTRKDGEAVYRGVAPGAKLVGVKVLNRWGGGTFSQVIAGIEWTIQNKDKYDISVISMSLGASVNGDGTTPVEIAATTAAENGISFVVAAGNSGPRANSVGIPASAKKVIAVGAVDNNHEIASFSSRGPTKDDRIKPEVSAPGVSVMAPTANTYDSYHRWSGTSMATPHVAGVVALLKEADPELNTEEISELLKKTALDKGEEGEDNTYGWGVVDMLQLLLKIYPQEHELLIKDIIVKDLYDTKTPIRLNAVIENKGSSDEENVNVKLYVNNVEISNRNIDEFKSGSIESAEFIYFPKKDGVYEMKVVVETVEGETIVFDNEYSREVVVKDYKEIISAVVLDSWGSQYNAYTIFDYLMENWNDFGEYSLDIDYTSFNNKEITYDDLKANGAEVLIISNAWSDGTHVSGVNWEFSDDEIAAIKKYVGEGHGLIVTAGTLSVEPGGVENNMKLSPLLGVDETSDTYWNDHSDRNFNINYKKHHLFDNMDDYYGLSYTLSDLKLLDGDLLAESVDETSMITGHHYLEGNTIHFTGAPEYYGSYHNDRQAFYNALVWTTNKFEDTNINVRLKDLDVDKLIRKDTQTTLKANIVNDGTDALADTVVKLMIDETEMDTVNVGSLAGGETKEISFNFVISELGDHEIEILVEPLDGESKTYDNYLNKMVVVPGAFMTGNFVESTTDSDEDGLYDSLLINVEFEIFEEGHYDLSGLLTSQLGVELLQAYKWAFLEKGVNNLQLNFRGLDLRRWGLNGPYTLKNLRLYSDDGTTNYDVEYQTEAYLADNFESYPDPSINYVRRNPWNPFVNDSVDIEISLENIGTEGSSEITVELYERKENNDILIDSTTTDDLGVFERSYVNFVVTSDKVGWIDYLVRITSEGDENLENNLDYFSIRVIPDTPQLYGYWSGPYEVPIGQEFDIGANVYYEEGRPDVVEGVVVDLFKSVEVEGVRTLELIGSEEIGDLRRYMRKVAQFSYMPEDIGELRLIGKLRADNPINEDNSFTRYIQVMPNEADVLGDFTLKESYGIINVDNLIYINVKNQGNNPARNVNVKLYDDGIETNDFSISVLGSGESIPLLSEWTPTTIGAHELELVVMADDDADSTNNAYKKTINVLDKKTLNFNIMDLLGKSIPRYLTLDEDRHFVNVIPFIKGVVDKEKLDVGINNIYTDETSYKDAFTVFLGSKLMEDMDVTTEYYEDIEDKGLKFSLVYANEAEWDYDSLSYNLLYYDEEVGVEDMSVYGCSDWDFDNKGCNIDWALNEEILKVIHSDGNFIMGEIPSSQALGLVVKDGGLIVDKPPEEDGQDPTPASSSDTGPGSTSSRRRSRGGASFASTGGNRISQSVYFSDKNAGETMKTKITNERLPIEYLEISFIGNQKRGYLHLNQVDTLEEIPSRGDNVYAYFSIDHHNINNNNIREGKMEFRVEKDWFTQRNVKKENVVLSRYSEGWEELPTSLLNSDAKYNYYTVEINGMSMFAISAKELEVVEIPIQVVDKKESKKLEADNNMWMIIGAAIIGILILVAIIVIVVLAERKKKKRLTAIKEMKWQGTNN